jgi:hypothetical protein
MENFKNAVAAALSLYAETSGMTPAEVGKQFAESEACRENVYLLVAMQANTGPYAQRAMA